MGIFRKKELGPAWARAFIGRWPSLFSTDDDADWAEWVDAANTSYAGLAALATNPEVRLSIRARAVYLLLVPDVSWSPFYGRLERQPTMLSTWPHGWLHQLPVELVELAADCAVTFREHVGSFSRLHPDSGTGSLNRHDAATDLNRVILELLGLATLPTTRARLFASYSLLDAVVFWNLEDASGYDPYERLMSAPHVEERWKRLAEAKLRTLVEAELSGERVPVAEHESAAKWYKDQVESTAYSAGGLAYSHDLLADQVRFVMAVGRRLPDYTLRTTVLASIFTMLGDEQYAELRHDLARYVMLSDFSEHYRLTFYGEDSLWLARRILAEFGDDTSLRLAIETPLALAERRRAEQAAQREALTHRYEAALARLH